MSETKNVINKNSRVMFRNRMNNLPMCVEAFDPIKRMAKIEGVWYRESSLMTYKEWQERNEQRATARAGRESE